MLNKKKKILEKILDTDLEVFRGILLEEMSNLKGDEVKKRLPLIGMLASLYDSFYIDNLEHRKIETIRGLYSLTKEEIIYGLSYNKKETWIELNKALTDHGLPPLKLPQGYSPTKNHKKLFKLKHC